jgi:DNA-binding XRE family transcriptional regulator
METDAAFRLFITRRLSALTTEAAELKELLLMLDEGGKPDILELAPVTIKGKESEKSKYNPDYKIDPSFVFHRETSSVYFADNARNYRLCLEKTALDVSKSAKVSVKSLYHIEGNTGKPTLMFALALSKEYGITLNDLETAFDKFGRWVGPRKRVKHAKTEPKESQFNTAINYLEDMLVGNAPEKAVETLGEDIVETLKANGAEREQSAREPEQTVEEPTKQDSDFENQKAEMLGKCDDMLAELAKEPEAKTDVEQISKKKYYVTVKASAPDPGFVFKAVTDTDDFLVNMKNCRLHLKMKAKEVADKAGCSDKIIYAIEARSVNGSRKIVEDVARIYGVQITDLSTKFNPRGFYIDSGKPLTTKVGEERVKRVPKEPKAKATALRKKLEKQRGDDLLAVGSDGKKITTPRIKQVVPANDEANAKALEMLPNSLKYRPTDPGHGLKAYVTRNYKRLRIVIKGMCAQRFWDFEETMDLMHEELEAWVPRGQELDFYGDNERFMSWAYDIAKGLKKGANNTAYRTKVTGAEEKMFDGFVPNPEDDTAELKAFMKQALGFKPAVYKTVFEAYAYAKKPLEESARVAKIPVEKAAQILSIIRRELKDNFGDKYNALIRV